MSAVLLAHTACKGIDSAVALVRKYVVQLRERGDRRGEVKMLHRLSTMSQVPPDALNSGQAALALATEIGDGVQEAAIKSTVTDLYVAMGKTDKAPNRKPAMKALGELVKAFEAQDKDRFQDAAKYMDGFYNALKQEDIELAITRVISKDPPTYMAFLEANGEQVADQKPVATTGQTAKTVLHEMMYFGFSSGGISYGPRYRPNRISTKRFNSTTRTISVLQLNDQSDQWERELGYNPSMLDGTLQHTAAAGYYPD
uniref:Uncharacterized protein n=1 Tax=Zooxanthella nutricula TaxID=1333877 RepID=A0A7S2VNG7_9DINO